jgi:hypothetical protein
MSDDNGQVFKFVIGGETHEVKLRPGPLDPNAGNVRNGDHWTHEVSTDPFRVTDYLPKPEDVTFGFVSRIVEQIQGPYPTDAEAAGDRRRYEMLLSRTPGRAEFIAILNTHRELGFYLTPDGVQKARVLASQKSGLPFAKVDQLLLAEVVAILEKDDAPRPARAPKPVVIKRKRGEIKALIEGHYWAAIVRTEIPPTDSEIASLVGCDPGHVHRILEPLESQRLARAKNNARDRYGPESDRDGRKQRPKK